MVFFSGIINDIQSICWKVEQSSHSYVYCKVNNFISAEYFDMQQYI